jgi:citrate lyase subunit beta / citryl-CoA lyase
MRTLPSPSVRRAIVYDASVSSLRSLIFSPGNRHDLVAKAVRSGADAVIVDLEDAVPAGAKAETRARLGDLPPSPVPLYVRVNDATTEWFWADVVAAARADVAGIVLPKAEDPDVLRRLDGALTAVEVDRGLAPGTLDLVPLIESARGVLHAHAVLASAERVRAVLFGSGEQGDLVVDLGVEWTPDGAGLLMARSTVVMAARVAGVQPLDAVFMNFRDLDALRTECELARRVGYEGKTAIHPAQVAVINDVFTPSQDEVAAQRRILEAFDRALEEGSASISVDGRMVDYAVARVARSIVARAEAAGRTAARTAGR